MQTKIVSVVGPVAVQIAVTKFSLSRRHRVETEALVKQGTVLLLRAKQAKEPDMGLGVIAGRATRATRKPTRKPRTS